jgi:hypothetical protein
MCKSQRARKSTITDNYIVYLTEECYDLGHGDPITFKQVIISRNSSQWLKVMNDEIKYMN